MKKIQYILIPLLLFAFYAQGQTYLQGEAVIRFSTPASSRFLSPDKRLTSEQSYEKLKLVDPNPVQKSAHGMTGEFWWIDGMLVQIVSRYTTSYKDTMSFEVQMYASRPGTPGMRGQPKDTRRADDYFDEIKTVNNFDVFIHYYKTLLHGKWFEIRDRDRKYIIRGTVYAKEEDFEKAHGFINTLLQSIALKE